MASSISAAIREVWSLELLQIISLCGWSRTDGSAAVRVPVIWYVSFPHGEPSVSRPVPVAGDGDASVPMEPEGDNGQQLISHHL